MRIGIAGIGAIAETYIELIHEGKIKNTEICAVSSRRTEHAEEVLKRNEIYGVTVFSDYETMLEEGNIEVVMICTPHKMHAAMAASALRHGIHPLIEKPLSTTKKEAEELLSCSLKHPDLTCGVLYCRRMSGPFQKIKSYLQNGTLGKLKRVNWLITNLYRTEAYYKSSPWRGTYKEEGGGLLMTQASHQLDLLLFLLPMPLKLYGFCYEGMERDISVENDVTIHMEFEGGATGQFIASSREFPGTNRLEIIGSKGQIILLNDTHLTLRTLLQNECEYARESSDFFGPIACKEEEIYFETENNRAQQSAIVNDFIEAVQNNRSPVCPLQEAIKSVEIINASYLSSWKKTPVTLPLNKEEYVQELLKK